MPNYADDKCSTTLVTNAQLRWWQMLNYAGDKCPTTLVTNAQLRWWQMPNYAGDKCPTTLVTNTQLHWWQMLNYSGENLFVGLFFLTILCLQVALQVSNESHYACKYSIFVDLYLPRGMQVLYISISGTFILLNRTNNWHYE